MFVTSGPGQYCPEKSKLDRAPEYSFGHRPDIDRPDNLPGTI